jgi:N-acetylneuraminic acid mutarotase
MKRDITLLLAMLLLAELFLISVEPVSSSPTADENTWVEKAPMPTARADLGVAVVDGKIYAVGGSVLVYQDALRTESKDVGTNEVYDPATNTWTAKKPMLIPSSGFVTAVYDGKIYCIGGGVTQFYNVSKNNWDVKISKGFNQVYNPATDTWESKTDMPIPEIGSQVNVVNGKIYLFGGYPNRTLNQVYDPVTDNWTIRAPIPKGLYGISSIYAGKIYVIGSYAEGGYFDSNDHYVPSRETPMTQIYDPESDVWSLKEENGVLSSWKPFAATTTGMMAPERIYIFYNPIYAHNNKLYENQVYDPATSSWVSGAGIPTQRNSFAVAVVDDLIYVIGGITITFPVPTGKTNPTSITTMFSTVEQYTPFGYGTVPPQVSVVSPENLNATTKSVALNFTINRPVDWIGYSLDAQDNVTMKGNITLAELPTGLHNITVYANDTFGNMGASETINFTITKPESLPISTILASSAALAVLFAVAGLTFFYRKHRGEVARK